MAVSFPIYEPLHFKFLEAHTNNNIKIRCTGCRHYYVILGQQVNFHRLI